MNIIRVANVEEEKKAERAELGEGNTSDFYAFSVLRLGFL